MKCKSYRPYAPLIYADGDGKVNQEGVAYYNNLINYLLQKGIAYN